MRYVRPFSMALFFICLLTMPAPGSLIYDAAADFSATNNPNGAWSYGWSTTLGSAFILDTETGTYGPDIDRWRGNFDAEGNPGVIHNRSAGTGIFSTISLFPDQLAFHPGSGNQYALIRWTAPEAGAIDLAAAFSGVDVQGTTTDVHILHNGISFLDGMVSGFGAGSGPSWTASCPVLAGDTIDFAVGYGANNNFFNDSTGIDASIDFDSALVPEPATVVLFSLGALGLGRFVRRRVKARF